MFASERHQIIIDKINNEGRVKVKDLAVQFEVSEDLIRKDLKMLELDGVCKRTYGGAMSISNKVEPNVLKRMDSYVDEKIEIARKAVPLIQDKETIYLDESTTNLQIAKLLATTSLHVTVISNMIDIIQALMPNPNITIIALGGTYRAEVNAFGGSIAGYLIEKFNFDRAFIGSAGIDNEALAFTTPHMEEAFVKEKIIQHSRHNYMVMDEHKFKSSAACRFATMDDFELLIINDDLTNETKKFLKKHKWKYI